MLGTALVVTMIGVSAMLTSRAVHRAGETTHRAIEARYLAHAAAELAILHLASDPDWRDTLTASQWTPEQPLGAGSWRYRVIPTRGTSLSQYPDSHVWLEAEGRAKDAVRLVRVALQPASQLPGANAVRNADAAHGTRHWESKQAGDQLEYTLDEASVGAGSLHLRNTAAGAPGIRQDVTDQIRKNETYHIRAAIRLIHNTRHVSISLITTDEHNTQHVASRTLESSDLDWRYITATLTPAWDGELFSAYLQIAAHNHTSFLLDDISMTSDPALRTMVPVPGTWQQATR